MSAFSSVSSSTLPSAEANHRIANSLAVIAGLVELQASHIAERQEDMNWREVQFVLEDVAARIKTVGLLHRLLSQDPRQETVELGKYLREVCSALTRSLSFAGQVHLIDSTAGTCSVDPQLALPLAVIVGELVTNSIKYAHPSGVDGQIRMSCHRGLDGSITIDIADDGVGFPQGFDPKADGGLGLRVVHLLSAQLGASVTFESADLGLRVRLLVAGAPH